MKINNLIKLWIYTPTPIKIDGEVTINWTFLKIAHLNLQQDLNELDRNSAGEIDYNKYKARTRIDYEIQKGDGVSLSEKSNPDFIVTNSIKIGRTITYTLLKNNGG